MPNKKAYDLLDALEDIRRGTATGTGARTIIQNAESLLYLLMSTPKLYNELDSSKSKILDIGVKSIFARVELMKRLPAGHVGYIRITKEEIKFNKDLGLPLPVDVSVSVSPTEFPQTLSSVETVYGMKESYESMKLYYSFLVPGGEKVADILLVETALNNKLSETATHIYPTNVNNMNLVDSKSIENLNKILHSVREIPKASGNDSQAIPTVIPPPSSPTFQLLEGLNNRMAQGDINKIIAEDNTTGTDLDDVNQIADNGGYSAASATKLVSIASLKKAPDGHDQKLWQAYCQYRISQINLAKNTYLAAQRVLKGQQAGSQIPHSSPQNLEVIHGPYETNYSIDIELLKKHADKNNLTGSEGIGAAFSVLLDATPELKNYFAMAIASGISDGAVWKISNTFGFFLKVNQPLETGDIVRIDTPMLDNGYCWGIVIKAEGWIVNEVICAVNGVFKRFLSAPGQVSFAWRPAPCMLFADNSQLGIFWGPRMIKMRKFVSQNIGSFGAIIGEEGFLRLIFENTRYAPKSCHELFSVIEQEITPIQNTHLPLPGCILFPIDYSRVGVMLSNGNFVLSTVNGEASVMPYNEFKPVSFWLPHV